MAVAGCIATALGDLFIAPIDTIKTLQQSRGGADLSMLGAAQQVVQRGGPLALFAGAESYVPADAVAGGLKFFTYEWMKAWGSKPDRVPRRLVPFWPFICGGVAFLASSVALTPGELIKQRLQAGVYPSILQGISAIWQTEGWLGFYQGYFSICLRDVPFTMLEMGMYDNLKRFLVRRVTPNARPAERAPAAPSAARRMAAEMAAGESPGSVLAGLKSSSCSRRRHGMRWGGVHRACRLPDRRCVRLAHGTAGCHQNKAHGAGGRGGGCAHRGAVSLPPDRSHGRDRCAVSRGRCTLALADAVHHGSASSPCPCWPPLRFLCSCSAGGVWYAT
jgi:hypothetical protein